MKRWLARTVRAQCVPRRFNATATEPAQVNMAAGSTSGSTTPSYAPKGAVHANSAPTGSEERQQADNGRTHANDSKPEQEASPWTVPRFAGVCFTTIGSLYIGYNIYKCNGNLGNAEIRIIGQMKKMHFYPPPGPSIAERNTRLPDLDHVDDETEHYLAHYFIHIDAQKGACGFTREDSLELIDAAGFNEDSEACKDFLMRAPGHIEERKRMSSCSLNELLLLVDALMASEDTDHLREQKAKSMVTIINQRVPFMPPFNARDSIRRAFGSFTEPLTEALAEVDSSETDMLQQELHGYRNRKEKILSQRRNPSAPLTPAEKSRIEIIDQEILHLEGQLKSLQ